MTRAPSVLCVLRSGGIYDAEWVRKLRDAVGRHLSIAHRFACLSDVDVPCERIPLQHDWPRWWAKLELFKPGVITGPTLYLDLDTIVTGPLDILFDIEDDFAMLRNFREPHMVGSGVMWFKKPLLTPYTRFCEDPERAMQWYDVTGRNVSYLGDQAFIWDAMEQKVPMLDTDCIRSYKFHCTHALPEGTSVVCFHGRPRPTEVGDDWVGEHWR